MDAAKAKEPTKRVNMTLRVADWEKAEKLRAAMGERSVSALVRRLIREASKVRGV